MNSKIFVSYITLLCLLACNSSKGTMDAPSKSCKTAATIIDAKGLDGCGLLLELENKKILEAVNLLELHPSATAGQSIFINYKSVEMAGICMRGELVELTCFQIKN